MKVRFVILLAAFPLFIFGCSKFGQQQKVVDPHVKEQDVKGGKKMVTSFYGRDFAGKKTASGEIFQPALLTAAHRSLPFGTKLRLLNQDSGKSVEVSVNDRGPFIEGRDLDISSGAASVLGMNEDGVTPLLVETLPR